MSARVITRVGPLALLAIALLLLIAIANSGTNRAADQDTASATPASSLADRQLSAGELAAADPSTPLTPTNQLTNQPTNQPTSQPTPTPTSTPSPTPTATPTPTPTPLPSQRLAEARHLHEIGDYAAARSAYAALLRDQPQGPEAYEARWRLGQAYLEDGQFGEAAVALEIARQEVPAEQLPPQVDFWLGEALAQLGQPERAIAAYRRYLAQEDVLAAELHLRIGRLFQETGDLEAALTEFTKAVEAAPDNFQRFAAREALAEVYAEQENWRPAVEQYDLILARSQYPRYRAEIQLRAGQVLALANQPAAAALRYRRALAEDESSPYALQALNALAELEQPVDDYTRGRILIANGLVNEGIRAIYDYLDAEPDHPGYAHTLVAEAYFGQRNYEAAIAEWQKLLDTHPEYSRRAAVLMRMAEAQARLGNTALARQLYFRAATQSSSQAPAALLEAARLAERDHDCRTAASEYLDLARLYPTAPEAGEALFRAGLCQYRLGQSAAALEAWQQVLGDYAGNVYAHASRFWAGKAALEQGRVQEAIELWQGLAPVAADSYYTARAAELAQAAGFAWADLVKRPQTVGNEGKRTAEKGMGTGERGERREDRGQGMGDKGQAEAERWLARWAAPDVQDPTELRRLPAAISADPQLQRGEAYLRVGLRGKALREFDAVYQRSRDDPLVLYPLTLYFRELGVYRQSILCAMRLIVLSPDNLLQAPLFIQRLAYPTYYSDLVEAEAAKLGIDPLLIYALIRQESSFERGARSYAAAQGLTQVIPSTAEWIANAIGWSGFQANDIYKPYINVKFGTYYLSAALKMFDGDIYAALVGYNAGPGNARRWLEQVESPDPDLFVEEITLSEPKLYVRRVLAHYAHYRRLYGVP